MRVLVVDDEQRMVQVIRRGLEAEGFRVEVSYDGEDALHRANEGCFDAIVLDILCPRSTGTRCAVGCVSTGCGHRF